MAVQFEESETHNISTKKQQRQGSKIERVEARLNPDQKRRIEYAARLAGTSVSDFMVSSTENAAVRAIEQHEVWTLAAKDREVFVKALLRRRAPSPSMEAAVRRYTSRVSSS
jgi:uncharacterized protein (DUF1778 family)